ncbi:MAG: hypothetical protein OXB88_06545 [Bacteriovoracales bacterium]|nr:hypothetical protein [Bacteriovoracales bacterium]
MRRLPKEINHAPKIFFLRFSRFFLFSFVAAVGRLCIHDNMAAFITAVSLYGVFLFYEYVLPDHFFIYFFTKVRFFERPHFLEGDE